MNRKIYLGLSLAATLAVAAAIGVGLLIPLPANRPAHSLKYAQPGAPQT
jgi:hypothetical protein